MAHGERSEDKTNLGIRFAKELYDHPAGAAAVLLDGWRSSGGKFLTGLHGSFNAVVWDRVDRRLHVITDRFGLKPIYVAKTANSFVVASEIKALLAFDGVDRTLSPTGRCSRRER